MSTLANSHPRVNLASSFFELTRRLRYLHNFKSASVTAPNDALVTCAAYFASTPRV